MAENVFFEYPDNQYHEGISLNLFKSEYSLAKARDKDGKVYLEWGYPQKRGEMVPIEKGVPWQVKLGDKDVAIEMLRLFIKALQGSQEDETTPF